jgi:hypothetical protein
MAKTKHTPAVPIVTGDIIVNPQDSYGYHVALKDHVMSMTPPKPGESNDLFHYVAGKS